MSHVWLIFMIVARGHNTPPLLLNCFFFFLVFFTDDLQRLVLIQNLQMIRLVVKYLWGGKGKPTD